MAFLTHQNYTDLSGHALQQLANTSCDWLSKDPGEVIEQLFFVLDHSARKLRQPCFCFFMLQVKLKKSPLRHSHKGRMHLKYFLRFLWEMYLLSQLSPCWFLLHARTDGAVRGRKGVNVRTNQKRERAGHAWRSPRRSKKKKNRFIFLNDFILQFVSYEGTAGQRVQQFKF